MLALLLDSGIISKKMKFYTKQHKYYCGIDLHTRSMYLCIINHEGKTVFHKDIKALQKAITPFLDDLKRIWAQKVIPVVAFIWDLFGFRFIFSKLITPIDPVTKKRKPITLTLWILGVYVAMYGIASQRYENRIDIIENRVTTLFSQLASPTYKQALSKIPIIQRMKCPQKPDILRPNTVFESLFAVYDIFRSPPKDIVGPDLPRAGTASNEGTEAFWDFRKKLFGADGINEETVELLKGVAEDWKKNLDSIDLTASIFDNANFESANFSATDLSDSTLENSYLENAIFKNAKVWNSNFSYASLENANFKSAELINTQLVNANMKDVDLSGSQCKDTNFHGANLQRANFKNTQIKNADFRKSNLVGVRGLTSSQIVSAYSFHNAKLDPDMYKMIKSNYGFLLLPKKKRRMMPGTNFKGKYLSKSQFRDTDLSKSDLSFAILKQANFSSANLFKSNLSYAELWNANLSSCNLQEAKLVGADLESANCWYTNFKNVDFRDSKLDNANMRKSDLRGAKNLSIKKICKTKTIHESVLDENLMEEIKLTCPEILTVPSYE